MTAGLWALKHGEKGTQRYEGVPELAGVPVILLIDDVISEKWELTVGEGIRAQK
jgi:hypothetical protein